MAAKPMVDLPAPDSPISPSTSPRRTVGSMPDDLLPDIVGLPLDPEAPDLQQHIALHAAARASAPSVRPAF
jgi:hypothetical protein